MSTQGDPPSQQALAQSLESEIREAFARVTCHGGCSWLRTEHNDNGLPEHLYGDKPPWERIGEVLDDWTKLIDDKSWRAFPGIGGFNFIDHVGYRYYLPVVMVRMLRGKNEEWFPGHLLNSVNRFCKPDITWRHHGTTCRLWSRPQLVSIARFVAWMAVQEDARIEAEYQFVLAENLELDLPTEDIKRDDNPWAEAVKGEWAKYLSP